MRLLFVSHSFPPPSAPLSNLGGMQRVATELYAALRQHGHAETEGLLLRTSWRWTHVRVVPFMAGVLWRLPRLVERRRIDAVLFSSMVTASLTVGMRRRLSGLPVVTAAVAHGRDVTLPSNPYQRFLPHVFDAVDLVLPVSRATGAACLERGLPAEKMAVVPNGINPARFVLRESRAEARLRLFRNVGVGSPLPADAVVLCSVGRQVKRKGFAWFIDEVMPRLPEHVHYGLAGEGPEREAISAAVARQRLGHRVHLLGWLTEEDLERLYRAADLFAMPNLPVSGDLEGFGVVMLEAGLCGLPTIAARLEGILDVVTEGANGHLVESGDASAFAERVLAYATDPERLRAASTRASAHVRQTFTWEQVAGRYVHALEALSASAKPAPALLTPAPPL